MDTKKLRLVKEVSIQKYEDTETHIERHYEPSQVPTILVSGLTVAGIAWAITTTTTIIGNVVTGFTDAGNTEQTCVIRNVKK
ncbi:hypothetical protein CrV_gp050 [Cylindrospermopsis raciborskii virus RM-2018a]|jgi:hypothetical protein|nr:hypothetical protein CrV_gp050 [Cylindrospermopsis raciborskii virus RM-2018a]